MRGSVFGVRLCAGFGFSFNIQTMLYVLEPLSRFFAIFFLTFSRNRLISSYWLASYGAKRAYEISVVDPGAVPGASTIVLIGCLATRGGGMGAK